MNILKSTKGIEEEFFQLDEKKQIATVQLEYEKASDIFDLNTKTKVPKLSEDLYSRITSMFDFVPEKYKLDIDILIDDMEAYKEKELEEIFWNNIMLQVKVQKRAVNKSDRLAFSFCITGLFFILVSILMGQIWTGEGIWKEIITFVLDILASVPFWGAMDIFVIDGRKRRRAVVNLIKRFHAIHFHEKQTGVR